VRLSALRAGRSLLPGRFQVLISVRGWVYLRAIVRLEGLRHDLIENWTRDLPACSIVPPRIQRVTIFTNYRIRNSRAPWVKSHRNIWISVFVQDPSSSSTPRQPEVEHWRPLNDASRLSWLQILFFLNLSTISNWLTHLFVGLPTGLFAIMLLSRIPFDMHFSSISCVWPANCILFNLVIFNLLFSSNCLCKGKVKLSLCLTN
jgi:hypothetical protein